MGRIEAVYYGNIIQYVNHYLWMMEDCLPEKDKEIWDMFHGHPMGCLAAIRIRDAAVSVGKELKWNFLIGGRENKLRRAGLQPTNATARKRKRRYQRNPLRAGRGGDIGQLCPSHTENTNPRKHRPTSLRGGGYPAARNAQKRECPTTWTLSKQ